VASHTVRIIIESNILDQLYYGCDIDFLPGAFETNAYPYAYTKKNIIDPTNMIATHCVFKTVLVCGFPAINLGINVTAQASSH
jgi:hypothetical protein